MVMESIYCILSNKKAASMLKKINFVSAILISTVFLCSVLAVHIIRTSAGGTTYNVQEDVGFIYNITINNSDAGASANITQVNISLDSNFIFRPGVNGSNANSVFANTSSVLSWSNSTPFLINGSANDTYFWFNATATNPGVYNITVITLNGTGAYNFQNISVTVNDTTIPSAVVFSSPATGRNYSGSLLLNVSVTDNGIMSAVYFNITNSTGKQNATVTASNPTGSYWNGTTNTAGFPDGVYNITAYANDSYNNLNSTSKVYSIIFDNTPPIVYSENISSPVNNGNYSGSILLNVSAIDALSGVSAVYFNITNSTGKQNATVTASNPTGSYWNGTLDTTSLPDGNYNITVYVNDTAGKLNNSALVYSIVIDNTVPAISFSCTPSTVDVQGTVSCSCSATSLSGINGSASYTVNPSTSNTGTYVTYCSATSYSGKSNSASAQYTVEQGGSGGGSSGGGSSSSSSSEWTKTHLATADQISATQGFTQSLAKLERVQFSVSGTTHNIGVKSVTSSSIEIEVASTPQKATLQVGETKKFEVTGDNFYDVYVKLNSIVNNKANLTIKSISEQIPGTTNNEQGSQESQQQQTVPATPEESNSRKNTTYWIVGIVVILIAAAVIIFSAKNKKR